jgi:hypothetical protein
MNECRLLSERTPEVVHGRAEWTPTELHHLSGCAHCRRELDLVQAASRLGEGTVSGLDSDEISRALARRLERFRARRAWVRIWTFGGLAAAAALAAVLWTGNPEPSPGATAATFSLPELDDLPPAELDSVLRYMDEPLAGDPALENGELGDLSNEELETVLDLWEG